MLVGSPLMDTAACKASEECREASGQVIGWKWGGGGHSRYLGRVAEAWSGHRRRDKVWDTIGVGPLTQSTTTPHNHIDCPHKFSAPRPHLFTPQAFKATQDGLALNIDVVTSAFLKVCAGGEGDPSPPCKPPPKHPHPPIPPGRTCSGGGQPLVLNLPPLPASSSAGKALLPHPPPHALSPLSRPRL